MPVLRKTKPCSTNGNITKILYTDSRLTYLGRWKDSGTNKFSGWVSPAVVFKITGVTSLEVFCDVIDPNNSNYCGVGYVIDDDADQLVYLDLTTTTQIFIGKVSATVPLPDVGEHTITLQLMGVYASQYTHTNVIALNSIQFDSVGILTEWVQGTIDLQVIGDSWAAAFNGWTRLLDKSYFKYNCIATPGFKITDIKPQYKYDYSGSVNTSDPTFDGIVVMFGVNEYNASVTTAQYKTNMLALIDEIRLRQATPIPIIMVIEPDNTLAAKYYSQYGTVIGEILALRTNTYACDLSPLSASLENYWLDDGTGGHLDYQGKQIVAAYLDNYLKTTVGL